MNTKVGRKPVIKRENNEPTRPQSHWRRGGRSGFPESPFLVSLAMETKV